MGELKNKISFIGIIVVDGCNPNGDPANGNYPRQNFEGNGIMSPECLKRKIRDRMQDMGYDIFTQSNHRVIDGFGSMKDRWESFVKKEQIGFKTPDEYARSVKKASEKWMDVRAFGLVAAFSGSVKSIGIRGPVSITQAKSLVPIIVEQCMITKSANALEFEKRDSSTVGIKYKANGAYVFSGGIHPQLAKNTGFSEEDAEILKKAILSMFNGDESASRPASSIQLGTLFWYTHKSKDGNVNPMKLLHSVSILPKHEWPYYMVDDYQKFDNVKTDVYNQL